MLKTKLRNILLKLFKFNHMHAPPPHPCSSWSKAPFGNGSNKNNFNN